jgi:hypothetical protein
LTRFGWYATTRTVTSKLRRSASLRTRAWKLKQNAARSRLGGHRHGSAVRRFFFLAVDGTD